MFEELDYHDTPLGALSLRRRTEPRLGVEVTEVKLGGAFLMSSLFTAGERALGTLAVGEAAARFEGPLEVAVGGLGLGYTAAAVLESSRVGSLLVVEALEAVIDWHRRGLLPIGSALVEDARCRLVAGDFFAAAMAGRLDPAAPARRWHAIAVDIDHAPDDHLHPAHAALYADAGLAALAGQLHPGGVFALWSNEPPDDAFLARLAGAFATARAEVVRFPNPLQGNEAANTVYLACRAAAPAAHGTEDHRDD